MLQFVYILCSYCHPLQLFLESALKNANSLFSTQNQSFQLDFPYLSIYSRHGVLRVLHNAVFLSLQFDSVLHIVLKGYDLHLQILPVLIYYRVVFWNALLTYKSSEFACQFSVYSGKSVFDFFGNLLLLKINVGADTDIVFLLKIAVLESDFCHQLVLEFSFAALLLYTLTDPRFQSRVALLLVQVAEGCQVGVHADHFVYLGCEGDPGVQVVQTVCAVAVLGVAFFLKSLLEVACGRTFYFKLI